MSLLRLRQFAEGEGRYRVMAEFENGGVRRSAESRFELQFTAQDQEDIRWYLEDFLQYPMDPAPAIAARIEGRMAEIGVELFTKVLGNAPVWHEVRHDLSGTRVEIETTVKDATALPWELLRDPDADVPLALRARAFVRAPPGSVQRPKLTQRAGGPIRSGCDGAALGTAARSGCGRAAGAAGARLRAGHARLGAAAQADAECWRADPGAAGGLPSARARRRTVPLCRPPYAGRPARQRRRAAHRAASANIRTPGARASRGAGRGRAVSLGAFRWAWRMERARLSGIRKPDSGR